MTQCGQTNSLTNTVSHKHNKYKPLKQAKVHGLTIDLARTSRQLQTHAHSRVDSRPIGRGVHASVCRATAHHCTTKFVSSHAHVVPFVRPKYVNMYRMCARALFVSSVKVLPETFNIHHHIHVCASPYTRVRVTTYACARHVRVTTHSCTV
jgi:hypothetical protein